MHTPLCDLLGLDVPILSAPFGPWDQVELALAVGGAGGLGQLGATVRPLPQLREQWRRVAAGGRPWAINHTPRPFDPEVFAASLEAGRPRSPTTWATRATSSNGRTAPAACGSSR